MPDVITVSALRCSHCGTLDPGPRDLCAVCHAPDLVPTDVPGAGALVSWTTIRRPPTRFRGQAPYTIAVVDLEAGLRLTGRVRSRDEDRLRLGLPVVAIGEENGAYLFEERAA